MPRGRPRKNKSETNLQQSSSYVSAIKKKSSKRLDAVFVDTVDAFDTDAGFKTVLNIYRIQPKNKSKAYDEDFEGYIYVGFDSDYIDNLEKGIIPTPLGSAEILDEDISDEEDDSYFDF